MRKWFWIVRVVGIRSGGGRGGRGFWRGFGWLTSQALGPRHLHNIGKRLVPASILMDAVDIGRTAVASS